MTLDGTLNLATNQEAYVTVTDGLTLGGTIDLGSANGSTQDAIFFDGAQTLGGTGSIVLGGASNTIGTASSGGDSGTLTIGSGITIEGQDGTIGNSSLPLINQGTIAANVSGGRISISGAGWSNSGTLEAENGGTLYLNGTWTNSGTVTVGSGSSMYLGGTFSLGAGSSFGGTGTLELTGTLDNAGTTLDLNGTGLSWYLDGGTISDGTIDVTNGATWSAPPPAGRSRA